MQKELRVIGVSLLLEVKLKMQWNLDEFYKLYNDNEEINNFLQSLSSKIIKSKRMGYQSIQAWNEYFSNTIEIDFESSEFEEKELEVEMYMEAAVHFMHSTADILLQIVNQVVLEPPLAVHQVRVDRVKNELSNKPELRNILMSTETLWDSEAFKYIDAFTNVMKHRNLIGSFTYAEFGEVTQNKIGLKFNEFEYRNCTYPSLYADDLMNLNFGQMQNLFGDIGSELNEYLKRQ